MSFMMCREDVLREARRIGSDLTDEQRIALGVTLIEMARDPESHAMARYAGRLITGHADMLLSDVARVIEAPIEDAPFEQVTVAPLTDLSATVTPVARGTAGTPGPRHVSSMGAAWARFRAAERRFSESIWGDALAGVCAVVALVGLSFVMWGLQ